MDVLASLNDIIDRIAALFQVDGEIVVRNTVRVLGIWLLAWVTMGLKNQPVAPIHDPRLQAHMHEMASHA